MTPLYLPAEKKILKSVLVGFPVEMHFLLKTQQFCQKNFSCIMKGIQI